MNILLVPIGSHGDVHPFVGIGVRLLARGHRVSVIVNEHFESLVRGAGLDFISLGSDAEYRQMATNADLWHRTKGPPAVIRALAGLVRPTYKAVVDHYVRDRTIVVGSSLALGARVAQDHLGIPTVTIHLQPLGFRSFINPPKFAGMFLGPRVPRWLMALQFALIDKLGIDRWIGPIINGFRKELGLTPVKGILRDWWNSPQRVIAMFPEWFAPRQADWPPQTRLTGFPLYDERGVTGLSAELRQFLDSGSPPIAITFGSAMWHAKKLLTESASACAAIGRRGILLTRHGEQVPEDLPEGVIHADFAPFSELLPRCAALVHHGGIGTCSQALHAGIPQLIVPHAHDQPDNAARVVRLGVGAKLEPRQYRAARAGRVLSDLLDSRQVAEDCRIVAGRFVGVDALARTCEVIEQVVDDK